MMKFVKYMPTEQLRPFVRHYVVSEMDDASQYKVFPTTGMVVGFQYKGQLSIMHEDTQLRLGRTGITGMCDRVKLFTNSSDIGTVLVHFTETGFRHFTIHPAHELFNLSLSMDDIFNPQKVAEVEDRLSAMKTGQERINVIESFLLAQLKDIKVDQLIVRAVHLICQSKGLIKIAELQKQLYISKSPFEKRFRQVVGTTAKKFASIVRFNAVIDELKSQKSLAEICYEHHFFDQAHFTKEFKQLSGESPENFKRIFTR